MRVRIDEDLCTGHGRCYALAPAVFDCDDSGFGVVQIEGDLDPERAREAELAAANCPERAVILLDGPAPA
jgi:ferredoxin